MSMSVGEGKRGVLADVNVVPLIDILLVLLVIFMIIPHHQQGLDASIPRQSETEIDDPPPYVVVVQVLADGSLRINQDPVTWDALGDRLGQIFGSRADRTAFVRGEAPVEFATVVRVLDSMRAAGIGPVGLLTPELEKGR